MSIDIRFRLDHDESFTHLLRDLGRRQMPFALALALTWTAKDAQAAVREQLGDTFTLRSKFVAAGIRVQPATKTTPVARVHSIDETKFLGRHVIGGGAGPKTPEQGTRTVAIPQVGTGTARPTLQHRTGKRLWPAGLLTQKFRTQKATGERVAIRNRYFIVNQPGTGSALLFKRIGKGKNSTVRLIYVLRGSVDVTPRWPFRAQVEEAVREAWPRNARKAIQRAIDTARPRKG